MNMKNTLAIVLIILGILGLVYGGFSYTEDRHTADLGAVDISVDEKEHVGVPVWVGVGAIVIGGLLLIGGTKR